MKQDLDELGQVKEDIVIHYFSNMIHALHDVHSHGFVYRDFKPDNILINKNGMLIQTDFEFAVHQYLQLDDLLLVLLAHLAPQFKNDFTELTKCAKDLHISLQEGVFKTSCLELILTGDFTHIKSQIKNLCVYPISQGKSSDILRFNSKFLGTLKLNQNDKSTFYQILKPRGSKQYYAPEIIKSQKVSFASDYWALGCCIFDLLYGENLFKGEDKNEIINYDPNHDPTNSMSTNCFKIFSQLLNVDPQERIVSFNLMDLFKSDWLMHYTQYNFLINEHPFIPSDTMIDLNVSSSFHVDHVNFNLNHLFDPPKSTLIPYSSKFQKDRTKTSISKEYSISKKQSTSANNLIPNLGTENVIDAIPLNYRVCTQIGNKSLFSQDSNAIFNSSIGTEERRKRRHSLSGVSQSLKYKNGRKQLSTFKSQQRVNEAKVVNANQQVTPLIGNISPIPEKKTSSNEDKETPSSDNEKEVGSEKGEVEESKEAESANVVQKELSEIMIRKSQIKSKYPKKQMIRQGHHSNRYMNIPGYLERNTRNTGHRKLDNSMIKQIHFEKRKKWKNMMTKGMSTIRPIKMGPRMEYRSNLSNTSLNRTMVNITQVGDNRHNNKLRDSLNSFNKIMESRKRKMFNSMFLE